MTDRKFNLIGLALNLIGVLILFLYGMPFHVPTGGAVHLIAEGIDPSEVALEHRYTLYGYIGLFFLVAGTISQMIAAWRAPTGAALAVAGAGLVGADRGGGGTGAEQLPARAGERSLPIGDCQMVDVSTLTDAELWQGIADNSESMAQVERRRGIIADQGAGTSTPNARDELVAAHERTWENLKREHDAYAAELDRRHPKKDRS